MSADQNESQPVAVVAPEPEPQVPAQPVPVAPEAAGPAVEASTPAPVSAAAVVDTNNPDYYERPISLQYFAQQNAWRTDATGHRVPAVELMGGFVYKMALLGRLADRESRFRAAFEEFCRS